MPENQRTPAAPAAAEGQEATLGDKSAQRSAGTPEAVAVDTPVAPAMCAACVHLRATGGIVLARTIRCTAFDSELSDAPSALAVVRANALILAEQGKCPAFDPLAKPNQPDSYVSLDLLDSRRAADLAGCPCTTCITRYQTEHQGHSLINHMVLCPKCGNKRCPHANNHTNACTGSNEPGQPGSNY